MDKILHEVLAEDKSLLGRRDELITALERKVPGNLKRDFTPIKKAISLNVGEKFLTGNSDKEATKEEVREILKASGMQAARIEFVIETFTKALDWDKPLIPVNIIKNFDAPEENVQQSKVNIIKIPYTEPKEISKPITNDESVKIEKPQPEPPVEKTEIVPHENPSHIAEPPGQNYQQQPRWQENSTPLPPNHKDKIFTTEGRLNRLAYFLKGLKLFFIAIIGGMLVEFFNWNSYFDCGVCRQLDDWDSPYARS